MVTNFWIEGFKSTNDRVHDAETLDVGRFIMGHFFGRSVPVEHVQEEANFSDDVFRFWRNFTVKFFSGTSLFHNVFSLHCTNYL
jgi:hypothetical protein